MTEQNPLLTDDDPRVQALAEAIFAPNQAAANMELAEYQRHCVEWCERNAGELFDLREQNAALVAENARLQADVKRLDDYRAMWKLRFGHTEDY